MRCHACAHQQDDPFSFCPSCGTKASRPADPSRNPVPIGTKSSAGGGEGIAPPAPQLDARFCRNCDKPIPRAHAYCPDCGYIPALDSANAHAQVRSSVRRETTTEARDTGVGDKGQGSDSDDWGAGICRVVEALLTRNRGGIDVLGEAKRTGLKMVKLTGGIALVMAGCVLIGGVMHMLRPDGSADSPRKQPEPVHVVSAEQLVRDADEQLESKMERVRYYQARNYLSDLRDDFARRSGIKTEEAESLSLECVKEHMNDPDSIKNVTYGSVGPCKYGGREGYWLVHVSFQVKNSFGGYVRGTASVLGRGHGTIKYYEGMHDVVRVVPACDDPNNLGHYYYPR
jgi:hypothetical protein